MGGRLRGVQMDAESCARWRGMFVPCSLPLSISLLNSPSCAASPPLLAIHLTTSTWLCASTLCNVFVWIVYIVRQTVIEFLEDKIVLDDTTAQAAFPKLYLKQSLIFSVNLLPPLHF